tara:strand:- start:105 stop:602 length:498 start_codon:yes stop_codon:yes gene_type:complete
MAKDLLDMLVSSIKVIELLGGVVKTVHAIDKTVHAIEFVGKTTKKIIREANSRKFQEKEYDVEWIDIKKTEWIDVNCKNNKKLYDVNGNIIVIGKPSPKIHTMATYDMNGNLIEDSPVKVKKAAKKVIFMDVRDKKDERGKLKKLYRDGYLSKSRYNSLMRDLNK